LCDGNKFGLGVCYINIQDWINIDREANSPAIPKMKLSSIVELDFAIFEFTYSSHLMKHLSFEASAQFQSK
jgi:hypothetical protein